MLRPLPTAQEVADFLDWEDATSIAPHLSVVTAMVRGYVRDEGVETFTEGPRVPEDLAAVIISATARSVSNPSHLIREEVGSWNSVPGRFDGFTLVEQAVLHAYRRRTA